MSCRNHDIQILGTLAIMCQRHFFDAVESCPRHTARHQCKMNCHILRKVHPLHWHSTGPLAFYVHPKTYSAIPAMFGTCFSCHPYSKPFAFYGASSVLSVPENGYSANPPILCALVALILHLRGAIVCISRTNLEAPSPVYVVP